MRAFILTKDKQSDVTTKTSYYHTSTRTNTDNTLDCETVSCYYATFSCHYSLLSS